MKTINRLRKYLPVVIFSTILIASAVEVKAQDYRKEGKKEKGNDRKEYREYSRDNDRTANNYRGDDRDRNYGQKSWNDREYHPKYSKKYKNQKSDYFEHPKYGRVYQRFDRNPVVFHHDRDDYYYYGNRFYRYRKGVGYCVVEPPRNVYFRQLPMNCERVQVNGNVLFRNGDLFFKFSPRGYALVNLPGVSISARF
jgi:hypothetical protein